MGMFGALSAIAILGAGPVAVVDAGSECAIDSERLLALPFDKFDQDLQGGWRAVEQKEGCRPAAADLLAQYRKAHARQLEPSDVRMTLWHEGQLRAAAGQSSRAIPLLLAGVPRRTRRISSITLWGPSPSFRGTCPSSRPPGSGSPRSRSRSGSRRSRRRFAPRLAMLRRGRSTSTSSTCCSRVGAGRTPWPTRAASLPRSLKRDSP
jgi:hypothetical protein